MILSFKDLTKFGSKTRLRNRSRRIVFFFLIPVRLSGPKLCPFKVDIFYGKKQVINGFFRQVYKHREYRYIFVSFSRSDILVKRQLLNVGITDKKLSLREGYT